MRTVMKTRRVAQSGKGTIAIDLSAADVQLLLAPLVARNHRPAPADTCRKISGRASCAAPSAVDHQ